MVECVPQIDRERIVCLLVEAELGRGAGLVPAGVVVVLRGLVVTENHVVVWSDVLGRVDDPSFERGVDMARSQCNDGCSGFLDNFAAEAGDAHLEPLVVGDRRDLLPEPSAHFRGALAGWARHEVEGRVGLLPELEPVAVVEPGGHAVAVHAERDRREPLARWLPRFPEERAGMKRLDLALRGGIEAVERLHDLPAREDLDLEPAATRLFDDLRHCSAARWYEIWGVQAVDSRHWTFGWAMTLGASTVVAAATAAATPLAFLRNLRRSIMILRQRTGDTRLRRRDPTARRAPGTLRTTRSLFSPGASSRTVL